MEPVIEFSKVVLHQDNAIIPNERLCNTPSAKNGCPSDLEIDIRIEGCDQIQSAGRFLNLPQVAVWTAQVIFHRFFYAKSFIKYSMMVSMTIYCEDY